MDNNIKPIETIYKGYRFRSRLEARWAVFFDACGVEWEYEPEGFDLGDGIYYLPDFILYNVKVRSFSSNLYIEVKGHVTKEDILKIEKFYEVFSDNGELQSSKKPLLVVGKIPYGQSINQLFDFIYETQDFIYKNVDDFFGIFNHCYCDHDNYPALPVLDLDKNLMLMQPGSNNDCLNVDEAATLKAYRIAKQVRFEHGEAAEIPAIISDFRKKFNLER